MVIQFAYLTILLIGLQVNTSIGCYHKPIIQNKCRNKIFSCFSLFFLLIFFILHKNFSAPSSLPPAHPHIHSSERVEPPMEVNKAGHIKLWQDQAPPPCIQAELGRFLNYERRIRECFRNMQCIVDQNCRESIYQKVYGKLFLCRQDCIIWCAAITLNTQEEGKPGSNLSWNQSK